MLSDETSKQKSAFKNPLLYSFLMIGVVLLYVGWILFSRYQENRSIERQTVERNTEKQKENDRVALEQLGGKDLAIQMFYASAASVHRGETLQLCYGVANAKSVKLEPQDNPVWPSHSRCVDVSPARNTTYTLTVDDGAGHTASQSLEVKVR